MEVEKLEYAQMSGAVYVITRNAVNRIAAPSGWELLEAPTTQPTLGFEAQAYRHRRGQSPAIDEGMRVVGARGDYNADGMSDLVLHNPDTGALTVWLMNGTQALDNTFGTNIGAGWTVFA
jgi:hypothetical protein